MTSVALNTAISMGITLAISALVTQISKWVHAQEEARQKAIELTNSYKEQKDSLDSQIEKYKELKATLDKGNLSTDETCSIKEQLLDIQKSLIESYGNEASNIDLVNGKYRDQLGLLSDLSKKTATDYVTENRDVFEDAKEALEKTRVYTVGRITDWSNYIPKTEEQQALLDFIESYSELFDITKEGSYRQQGDHFEVRNLVIKADVESADKIMHQFAEDLEQYGKENNIDVSGILEGISGQLKKTWTDELTEYKTVYDEFMKAEVVRNDTLRPLYQQSIQAVEDYNNALSSSEGVENAKANLDAVQQSVQNATSELEGSQEVFNGIYDGINKNAESTYNLSQAFENDDSVQGYAEQLKGLTDIDLKAINFEDSVQSPGEEAFGALIDILGLSEEEVQNLIDKLVELGYVQGEVKGDTFNNETPVSSFEEAWNSLDNTEDSDLKGLKQDVLELAKAGQLTEETFNKVNGAKKWAKSIKEPIDSVIKKINSYVTSSDQLSSMSEGISALTENLYNKTKNKKVKFIDADTLSKMPNELKACKKEWKEYERVMGDANSKSKDAKKVTDALASAYVNNGNFLSNITRKKRDSYVAQMESIGITNAEAIADEALFYKKEILANKEDALAIAAEAAKGEISDESQALINHAEMSDRAKAALIDLAAQETIFNNNNLSTEEKVDALNRLAESYFGVSGAIELVNAGVMGTDSRFVIPLEEQWQNFVNEQDDVKVDTTPVNPNDSDKDTSGSKEKSSKFFDYIEIRLKRLERLRSNHLKNAEDSTKSLTERTKNYNKALGDTEKQINTQNKAIKRYEKDLKKIGLDESIAKKIRDGAFDTDTLKGKKKEQAEEYQELWEKKLAAEDDRDELISNKNQYKRNKIQLKIDNLENKRKGQEILTDQLQSDFQLTSTSGDYSVINNSISEQIKNFKKQNRLIKEQQALVKRGSEEWYSYQDSIDSNNQSIQDLRQSMIDLVSDGLDKTIEKLDTGDELIDAKIANALTADEKNKFVDEKISNIDIRGKAYKDAATGYANAINVTKSGVLNTKVSKADKKIFKQIKKYVNDDKLIPEDILSQITDTGLLESCESYNSAITAYETNKAAKDLYEETSKQDKRSAVQEGTDYIKEDYDSQLNALERDKSNTDARIKKNEALGVGQSRADYKEQIKNSIKRQDILESERKSLEGYLAEQIRLGNIVADENDPAYKTLKDSISECTTGISDCITEQIEYNRAIDNMDLENYKSLISLLEKGNNIYKRFKSLADVHGSTLSDDDLFEQIGINNKIINGYEGLNAELEDDIKKYLIDPEKKLGLTDEQIDKIVDIAKNSPENLAAYMESLGIEDFNEKHFPELFENINELHDNIDAIYQTRVENENLIDEYFDNHISKINDYLDALKKEKDIKDRTLAIEKAQYDLNKAKNNLTKKVWDGSQWVYTSDTEAVQSAQEAFDNAQYEELVNVLEDLTEALEEFKTEELNLYDDYGNQINTLDDAKAKASPYLDVIEKIFGDNGIDAGTPDREKVLDSILSSSPLSYNLPENTVPDFSTTSVQNPMNISKIELILPNVTDNSTATDLTKDFLNELSCLKTYAAQYNWNK